VWGKGQTATRQAYFWSKKCCRRGGGGKSLAVETKKNRWLNNEKKRRIRGPGRIHGVGESNEKVQSGRAKQKKNVGEAAWAGQGATVIYCVGGDNEKKETGVQNKNRPKVLNGARLIGPTGRMLRKSETFRPQG